MGDTVNVASRLQSAAQPGSVTVGERTMRATGDAVRYEPLEPLELKGKAERVPAWEAVGLIAEHAVGRLAPTRESPLVGRTEELAALETLYERVVGDHSPHLVTLVGEAGVGKSRSCASSSDGCSLTPRPRLFALGAACATGAARSSGHWARSCARSAGSSTPTRPTRPGTSSPVTSARQRTRPTCGPATARRP